MTKKKKITLIVIAVILAILILPWALFFTSVYWEIDASRFTDEQHIERITKGIEKQYIKQGKKEGYEIHPVYNESDEMEYCVIDFKPSGYLYIKIYDSGSIMPIFFGNSMYSKEGLTKWRRFRFLKEGEDQPQYPYSNWKKGKNGDGDIYYDNLCEVDKDGNFIEYKDSHFKVAGVKEEKRYLLRDDSGNCIPAIKSNDRYLNLISMEEMDVPVRVTEYPNELFIFFRDPHSVL